MTDFAAHEAIVSVLRHMGDTTLYPNGLYTHNFGQPNQAFHLIAWALSYVVSVRSACKIVVVMSLVAIAAAVARLARYEGRTPWVSLLVAPTILGWTFYWGFVANLLGIAVLIGALPAIDRMSREPTLQASLIVCGWFALLYLAHELPLFVAFGFVVLSVGARGRTVRSAAYAVLPIAFGLMLTVLQAHLQDPLRTRANKAEFVPTATLMGKIYKAPLAMFGVREGLLQAVIALTCLTAVGLLYWQARAAARLASAGSDEALGVGDASSRRGVARLRALADRHWVWLLEASCLALYGIMPAALHGATFVYERFIGLAMPLLAVASAPRSTAKPRLPSKLCLAAVPLSVLFLALPQFAAADKIGEDLDTLLPLIERGSAVANLDLQGGEDLAFEFHPFMMSNRVVAERGGRLMLSFLDSTVSPALVPREHRWDEALARNNVNVGLFRPYYDLRRFRYVLACIPNSRLHQLLTLALSPEARLIGRSGWWSLYESTILSTSILASESPSPPMRSDVLASRVNSIVPALKVVPDFDVDARLGPIRP